MEYRFKKLFGIIFSNSQTIRWQTQGRILANIWKNLPAQSANCLDVGCGGGSYAIDNFLGKGQRTTLCDYSVELLALARQQVESEKLSHLAEFARCSAESLPFNDNQFDRIQCMEVLEHVKNPGKALEEMARVAKPSAYLVLSVPHPPEWFHNPDHMVEGFTADEIKGLVENAGWRVVRTEYCMLILTRLVIVALHALKIPLPLNPLLWLELLAPRALRRFLLPYDIMVVAERCHGSVDNRSSAGK